MSGDWWTCPGCGVSFLDDPIDPDGRNGVCWQCINGGKTIQAKWCPCGCGDRYSVVSQGERV